MGGGGCSKRTGEYFKDLLAFLQQVLDVLQPHVQARQVEAGPLQNTSQQTAPPKPVLRR